MQTVATTIRTEWEVILPTGLRVTIRLLRMIDVDNHITIYSRLLAGIALMHSMKGDGELTQQVVTDHLAQTCAETYAVERADEQIDVLAWLQLFSPALTTDILDDMPHEDLHALLLAIMEDNPSPFALTNPAVHSKLSARIMQILEMTSLASSDSSTAPASTPETPS